MVSFLIAYMSWSGNTREVAELIRRQLNEASIDVTLYRIGSNAPVPDVTVYDAFMLGCFTWGKGDTPVKVKKFIAQVGFKPELVYIFGTGDTQFGGDDLFCHAATKLAKFYHSPLPPLRIEQSPRGHQEQFVEEWTERVIQHFYNLKRDDKAYGPTV